MLHCDSLFPQPISGKNVNAALTSAWGSTPVQLEASEFLAGLDEAGLFWPLAEKSFWAAVSPTDKVRSTNEDSPCASLPVMRSFPSIYEAAGLRTDTRISNCGGALV